MCCTGFAASFLLPECVPVRAKRPPDLSWPSVAWNVNSAVARSESPVENRFPRRPWPQGPPPTCIHLSDDEVPRHIPSGQKTPPNSKCRILHDLPLARFCHLRRLISFASHGDVAEIDCRQHQPRPISPVFTRKSTDLGSRETSNPKPRTAPGRADRCHEARSRMNHFDCDEEDLLRGCESH
jgi:hypothetical protein